MKQQNTQNIDNKNRDSVIKTIMEICETIQYGEIKNIRIENFQILGEYGCIKVWKSDKPQHSNLRARQNKCIEFLRELIGKKTLLTITSIKVHEGQPVTIYIYKTLKGVDVSTHRN